MRYRFDLFMVYRLFEGRQLRRCHRVLSTQMTGSVDSESRSFIQRHMAALCCSSSLHLHRTVFVLRRIHDYCHNILLAVRGSLVEILSSHVANSV